MKKLLSKLAQFVGKHIYPIEQYPPLYYNNNRYKIISTNWGHCSDETKKDTLEIYAELDAPDDNSEGTLQAE
jgi:hypothetical protein